MTILHWKGIDRGREGFLNRGPWYEVLRVLYDHQGENHNDVNSPLFSDLENRMPNEAWRGADGDRSLFRDYQTAWTNTGVMVPTAVSEGFVELTTVGKELVENPETLTEFFRNFVDHYVEYWDASGHEVAVAPFLTIATVLAEGQSETVTSLQLKCESRLKAELHSDDGFNHTDTTRRRFRSYLKGLENAEVAHRDGQNVIVDDFDYIRGIVDAAGLNGIEPTQPLAVPESAEDWLSDQRRRVAGQRFARDGQELFKTTLLRAYEGSCAITGTTEARVLEGAHIMPYLGRHTNQTTNGLLLAVDIHRLFDRFALSVVPETHVVAVHRSVTDPRYRELGGRSLRLPRSQSDYPDKLALTQHFEQFNKLG